ncbi:MAG: PrsW family intramembrane metalloprotease [Chloroflexi bacterium]|nr:PrsW family intramembrane metalloprotease [Chloroflexota bacterium]
MAGPRPGPDEQYCWSCRAIVKRRAVLCMSCGARLYGTEPVLPAPPAVSPQPPAIEAQPAAPALERDLPRPSTLFAVLLAISGGFFGIVGAIQAELPAFLLAPYVWGPVAEEMMKPVGVYIMLIKWPLALKNRAYTAMLCAISGVAFALVESTMYMFVYFPEHTQAQLLFRFTVPVALHAAASFVFGLGINRQVLAPLTGSGGFRRSNWAFFLAAIALHSFYNFVVTVVGVLQALKVV